MWPVKIVPEMTYKVSSGTLNLCSLTGKPPSYRVTVGVVARTADWLVEGAVLAISLSRPSGRRGAVF